MQTSVDLGVCPTCHAPYSYGESTCRVCGRGRAVRITRSSMHILRPIWIVMLLAALVVIGTCIYSNVVLVRSEAYKDSLTRAFSSPEIQNALGSGIHAKSPALGYLISLGNSRFAEWSVGLARSRGKGHLYGVANQINGVWEFSRLTFESEARKGRVDITPIRQLVLPPVPTKNVYVVPIGLIASQAVDWAPRYYKARLGGGSDRTASYSCGPCADRSDT